MQYAKQKKSAHVTVVLQCESKKIPPEGSLHFSFFSQTVENFLIDFSHTYYTFQSTLDYKFLFNYPRFWRRYAIL